MSTQAGPAGRSMMRVVSLLLRPLSDVLMMAPHSDLEVPHSEVIAKAAAAVAKREKAEKRALDAGMALKDMPKNFLAEEEEEERVKLDPAAQVAVNAANSAVVRLASRRLPHPNGGRHTERMLCGGVCRRRPGGCRGG